MLILECFAVGGPVLAVVNDNTKTILERHPEAVLDDRRAQSGMAERIEMRF